MTATTLVERPAFFAEQRILLPVSKPVLAAVLGFDPGYGWNHRSTQINTDTG
jgi:hypothetical protein